MKLLYVTARFPYPPLKGDQAVPWNRLRVLSKDHAITLLSFYETDEQLQYLKHIQQYCAATHLVKLSKAASLASVAAHAPFSSTPMQVLYYKSSAFEGTLQRLLSTERFDLIHAFMLRIAPYLMNVKLPKVLELIDSMQLNLQRRAARSSWILRPVINEELRRVIPLENALASHFDEIVVTSQQDGELIDGNNVNVVALGVDTREFRPRGRRAAGQTLIFTGNMSYAPNIDAVTWFAERCFDSIRREFPDTSLIIAGANPHRRVLDLSRKPGVKVLGFVPSIGDALNGAQIAIAPMQSGSGMQFKILEAMACGLPVITTSVGLGDIKASPEHELILADNAADFVGQVKRLLIDSGLREKIGRAAREFVSRNHSWDSAAGQLSSIYGATFKKASVRTGVSAQSEESPRRPKLGQEQPKLRSSGYIANA